MLINIGYNFRLRNGEKLVRPELPRGFMPLFREFIENYFRQNEKGEKAEEIIGWVEKQRLRKYGTEEDAAALEADLKARAGITGDDYSQIGILNERAKRNITAYKPEALTETEEEKKRAIESRKLQLQEEELAARKKSQASQAREMTVKNPNLLKYGSV